jgi:flagellar hook-associated protein 1 FlgK
MSRITSLMDTGKRSMMNSQTALQTAGHNIANKTTEGYSRQRVDIESMSSFTEGQLRVGMGARAAQVSRINNPYIEKQIQRESAQMSYHESRADALARVEDIFNEQSNKGLNQYLTDFFNSWRELSNSPESLASRTMVKESSQALAKDFNRVDKQLTGVQNDIDGQIMSHIDQVNQYTKEIASLNEKIQSVEMQGIPANDDRDRRDLLLKKLGEKINITFAEGTDTQVTVTAGKTALLVSGFESNDLKCYTTGERDRLEIFFKGTSSPRKITEQITGGVIGGGLEVRDHIIEDAKLATDKMAYTLAKEVNRAHIEGYDRNGKKGILFFEMPERVSGAAAAMTVNETILRDPGKISAGMRLNAPSDNSVANVVTSLQNHQLMDDGGATLDDYYNSQVGKIGVVAQRAMKTQEAQKSIVAQLTNIRESISGVSLDEETTKMIEFQKAYDASARLIRTSDELFDTVLNIKRM